ncbi:amino acid ABC transporter substrate-binding protein [Methanoplanus sp. FWC-SCC4]|uniref:Amino acid ABC transporter substrate-binding protein n=1 Tax=Methanochimaera problematica TaxID=2609417 RepID=A0AA97I3S1_9EURY|nr:ABC transporter substrate-binding protein [Methanoplanus sp. FWC-SCC4]WOF15541.1 amino acid ABC transporter substrate-binding protein [Methanoplanus sp. FWC-SCC4]
MIRKISISTVLFLIVILISAFFMISTNFGPPPGDFPDEIVVGSILPLSGPMETYGIEIKRGIDMAVSDINEQGGIKGTPLSVEYFDNLGNPNMALFALKKFAEKGVPVIIGPVSSTTALTIAPYAEEEKVVIISPAATNPNLSEYKDYFFRTISSDIYQGKGMAKVLPTMYPDVQSAAVLYLNNDYGRELKNSFVTWFPKAGGHIVLIESYEPREKSYSELIDKIIYTKPDAVVLIGTVEDAGIILKEAENNGVNVKWFCSEGLVNDELPDSVGKYSEGIAGLMQSSQVQSKSFIKRYESEYGTGINWPVSYGYDTMAIVSEAISAGGYKGPEISSALKRIRYLGLCGPKVFDENGDIPPAFDIMRIENGKWQRVKWNQIVFSDEEDEED